MSATTIDLGRVGTPGRAPNGTPTPVETPRKSRRPVTWQQVTTVAILVLGACVLAIFGHETIAAGLAGGATGFAINRPKHEGTP